ncbi:SHQ1, putative [Entamoeba histolytica HM-1:IMSS-B]|uniref:CS domain-containing protein n=6 Tax=Entamoeba histolytica TaxID=5759 RepID=C4M0Q3_ENTH1|nr:hypothetical protein, conserved [Entamoeba histolytica HM-1:IMSS]EMD44259.1 SHQ1 protein [Entamoeba histolytica KU27]EMH74444.1 SHQ1, putative [Entamoeba histolytica HM-1:IMSS-B]ENY61154.1 SHQ1 protein, putative [Entamoeba histolytica HM-1:IMSS-A]GAT94752.1 hypothetical protein conserved [Entamoeba histolytica]EAL51719.1 hypothetical protein, conserved [Entamoeba histolytica HM-1:IMSS]|eukprot:XP_657109.1 hypothetical protein, conserved [Entamoeba histolytica HM-1:IMSS]
MITPYFSLTQNNDYVIVHIKIPPYQQFGVEDIQIDNNTMIYHSEPYFLSLTFKNDIAKDGTEKAEIDRLECKLHVYLPKENKGEVFPDLDMLPLFLTKKKILSRVQVLNTSPCPEEEKTEHEVIKEITPEEQELIDKVQRLEKLRQENEIKKNPNEKTRKEERLDFISRDDLILGEDQQIRDETEDIVNIFAPKYGFNGSHSEFFKDLQQNSFEIVMLRNPDQTDSKGRRKQRIDDELNSFDKDRYICDTFEWDNEEEVLKNNSFWWKEDGDWTDEERNEFGALDKIEVLVNNEEVIQIYKDLFGIVYGYLYDQIVMGESTVESGWTIATLSPVMSYFDRIDDIVDLIETCIRRSLIYPVVRNWELSMKTLEETIEVFKKRRVVLMKILLRIHQIYKLDELKHYMNYLFFDEYCNWIQSADDQIRHQFVVRIEEIKGKICKENIGLPLQDAEQEYIDYISSLPDDDGIMSEEENEMRGYID